VEDEEIIGIHPGSNAQQPFKRWPLEKYTALADAIRRSGLGRVAFFLGPDESSLRERLRNAIPRDAVVLPASPLGQSIASLLRCRGFVGNDSALLHFAAALGLPAIGIFGPTDPSRTAPWGPWVKVVGGSVSCSPCYRFDDRSFHCGYAFRCWDEVRPQDVLHSLKELMEPSRRGSALQTTAINHA
jgi:ADP-heptose:LPS heptosyltransferase